MESENIEISQPFNVQHVVSLKLNRSTGKIEGVPDHVTTAIEKAGYKEEQIIENPLILQDLLATLPLNPPLEISAPIKSSFSHNIHITFNKEAGRFEGIPEEVRQAILDSGLKEEEVMQNPELARDILFKLSLSDVLKSKKESAPVEISAPTNVTHLFAIKMNKETGKLEGIPDSVRKAFEEAKLTEEEVLKNPSIATDILSKLSYQDVVSHERVKEISAPTNVHHKLSITINPHTGKFEGVPDAFMKFITERGLTIEQIISDINLATYILEQIEKEGLLKDVPNVIDVSKPLDFVHNFAITVNKETGKLEGIPPEVRKAFEDAGLTEEQVLQNPSLAVDILSKFSLDDFKPKLQVSAPLSSSHNISIKFNRETGKFEGIPEEVRKAVLEAGLTEQQVMEKPELAADILYKLSLEDVLKSVNK